MHYSTGLYCSVFARAALHVVQTSRYTSMCMYIQRATLSNGTGVKASKSITAATLFFLGVMFVTAVRDDEQHAIEISKYLINSCLSLTKKT